MRLKRLLRLTTISILFLNLGVLCTSSKILGTETDGTNRCSSITLKNAATPHTPLKLGRCAYKLWEMVNSSSLVSPGSHGNSRRLT